MSETQTRFSNIMQRLGLIASFTAGLLAPWCYRVVISNLSTSERQEIALRVSPDKMDDAIVLAQPPSFISHTASYEVEIEQHATKSIETTPVLSATHAADLNLRWVAPHLLEIDYGQASVNGFTDHWAPCPGCPPTVEIHLEPSPNRFSYSLASYRSTSAASRPNHSK